jgi:cytoskeletal protein CcmA (bactofilin family)
MADLTFRRSLRFLRPFYARADVALAKSKFLNNLLIDGEVEGTIDSTGTLTIGEHASIRGDIRTKSVKVRGTVEGNIFVTERCELQAGSTLRGDVEAPRLLVDEKATFLGSAKVGTA